MQASKLCYPDKVALWKFTMEVRAERRALDKIYKRRDRYEIPGWQRSKVWSTEQKRRLIDTILRGWKLPKFYFASNPGKSR
jgi:hypothetical protein